MKTEALHRLRCYWESLRDGREAPYRAELDPRRFEDVLEHMFILEQVAPGQLRVRLAGLTLCDLIGMEVRGMPPEALISAPHRAAFGQHLHSVLTAPAVVELDLSTEDARGRQIPGQMLLLPLRSDFGEITRILGCAVTGAGKPRVPANFTIVAHRVSVIRTGVKTADSPLLPGFAEPARAYAPQAEPPLRAVVDNPEPLATAPRRGHLRIVTRS